MSLTSDFSNIIVEDDNLIRKIFGIPRLSFTGTKILLNRLEILKFHKDIYQRCIFTK